jgi:soluble epoxide hydrolase / lipid-phosphate phosphatase
LTYQIFFEKNTQVAIAELNKDIRRSLRATLRCRASPPPDAFLTSPTSFLDVYSDYEEIPPSCFYVLEEEDYMVEEFSKQGFDYSLQFYTYHNRYESWRASHEQGNHTIPQPALFIAPLDDPVADWIEAMKILGSEKFLPHLTTKTIDTHHWPHLEAPEEFNKILDEWLKELGVTKPRLQEAKEKRHGSKEEL